MADQSPLADRIDEYCNLVHEIRSRMESAENEVGYLKWLRDDEVPRIEKCRDALEIEIADLRAKLAAAEEHEADVAHAIGVEYAADGVASAPGPREVVVQAIRDAARDAGQLVEARAKVGRLEARIAQLRKDFIVEAVQTVPHNGDWREESMGWICAFCDGDERAATADAVAHKPDCVFNEGP